MMMTVMMMKVMMSGKAARENQGNSSGVERCGEGIDADGREGV